MKFRLPSVVYRRFGLCLVLFFPAGILLSCASGPKASTVSATTTRPSPPNAERPSGLRLGNNVVVPMGYRLHLTLDPRRPDFAGEVEIDLKLAAETSSIQLHAKELTIARAHLMIAGVERAAKMSRSTDDRLLLSFEQRLPAGAATLRIGYRGKLSATHKSGAFRRKEVDDWYVYTQFEPIAARRAFPCFDEPEFKVPIALKITAPKSMGVFANAPAKSTAPAADDQKTVQFAATPPIPTYLLAFAVGPFDVLDGGVIGQRKIRSRVITPKGRAADARFALDATPAILERLEAYFGRPYPYAKLDQIAVPGMAGAMENPGLITYRQSLILSHHGRDSIRRKRAFAEVCAHELAHIWFGDLVTMKWWDDLWLNESFATWMSAKIIADWQPSWGGAVRGVVRRGYSMDADSLKTSRRIRQPIASVHDIRNAFDGITYGKGAAVLKMFETWLGEERFREGVRRYIAKHAWKNAAAGDFLAALDAASGQPISAAFATFLDRSGTPEVTLELSCEAGAPKARLSQRRYRPLGSAAKPDRAWQLPVCLAFDDSGRRRRQCFLMTERERVVPLQSSRCPAWVIGNDGFAGYYRVAYSAEALSRLVEVAPRSLSRAERVGLIDDIRAMVAAGDLPIGRAFAWLPSLVDTDDRFTVAATARIVRSVYPDLVPEGLRTNYSRFVKRLYARQARALGWRARQGESEDTRLLRADLLALAADVGKDVKLVRQAKRLTRRWLRDRRAIDSDLTTTALAVAGSHGSGKLYKELYRQAKRSKDRRERRYLLGAMAAFEGKKELADNLALLLSPEFEGDEALTLLRRALRHPATRDAAYRFIRDNFDAVQQRVSRFVAPYMFAVAGVHCDEAGRKDAEAFFGPKAEKVPGAPRLLAQALERARLCVERRRVHQASLAEFLSRY